MNTVNQSEVARLRQQIALEHQAALMSLASGTARHEFITARMERIGAHQESLARLIGEEQSMAILCEVIDQ